MVPVFKNVGERCTAKIITLLVFFLWLVKVFENLVNVDLDCWSPREMWPFESDFSAGKTWLVLFDWSNNTGAINVKTDEFVLEEKSSFKMLGLISLLNWIGAVTLSLLLNVPPRKLEPWFVLISLEVALYLYRCMEYCCHVRAGAPSCYLELSNNLQKQICRYVCPSLAVSFEPLAHRLNVARLSLSYRYYFGRCSPDLAQLVPLLYSYGRSTRYCDRLHKSSVGIPICYQDVYVNSFIPLSFLLELPAYRMLSLDVSQILR